MEERLRAIAVGVNTKEKGEDFEYNMLELKGLAEARRIDVLAEMTQNLPKRNHVHYIGKGKIDELLPLIEEVEADVLIANDELSPSQIRVLEEKLDLRVMDRTMLILDIFAERAQTREAQLQVEVAQLQYMLPRLIGRRESLGRQGGGSGLANRGAGETKLELDRRRIEDNITALNKELEALVDLRKTQRKQRKKSGIPVVSLVGYTNAGKSTTMNALLETFNSGENKQVFEKDMLFATLDTSVRNITLPDNKSFLLTDTVGFVNKLPHHLVKAFRSTLEEVAEADLIVQVVDYSDPHHETMMEVTNKTLDDIGVGGIPMFYAFNKAELVDEESVGSVVNDRIYLSAKQRKGIDELVDVIKGHIFKDYKKCDMLIPFSQGQLISYFNEHANVLHTEYEENGTKLTMECRSSDFEKYREYVVQ
ncbi:GTPase HflX [[Bacillus] enclensis]|uniref:GTPase HflX n=1 Tax=[Bacillus] enclensis TaxID=1402860 RepID=UPI0018DC50A6|nr:GTPase HflX [[Bacillus] enclensis]MBH9966977.1 GTPase HflX [[Bacillus] enclensis]QWC24860.1 GTPase HflX [Bacillus haikouensis]